MWYVNNLSLWLDLKIIALTVWKILKREGISQPGQATMEEFGGQRAEGRRQKAEGRRQKAEGRGQRAVARAG